MIIVYITCSSGDEAWTVGHKLMEEKLAACVVTFPARSMYWWKGKIEESTEHVLFVKTKEALFDKLKNKVKEIHSYETPCIIRIEGRASPDYDAWLQSVLV